MAEEELQMKLVVMQQQVAYLRTCVADLKDDLVVAKLANSKLTGKLNRLEADNKLLKQQVDHESKTELNKLRAKVKNQREQLKQLNAVYDSTLQKKNERDKTMTPFVTAKMETSLEISIFNRVLNGAKSKVASTLSQQDACYVEDEGAFPFEKKVLKVLEGYYSLTTSVKKQFEDTGRTLPTLRPSLRAALLAMPPATRALCVQELDSLLPAPEALLASSKAKKMRLDDRDLKGCSIAKMAVFWGHLTGYQLVEDSGTLMSARPLVSYPLTGAYGPKLPPSANGRGAARLDAPTDAPAAAYGPRLPPPCIPAPAPATVLPALELLATTLKRKWESELP